MRGCGFGRYGYEKPQPGLQFHSYEDAIYPPRAYRYHIQQAVPSPATPRSAGSGSSGGGAGASSAYNAEVQVETTIVLPTIDADATCGPFIKAANAGGSSAMSAASSSLSYVRGSASSVTSNSTEGRFGTGAGASTDAERRPPPRLRYFLECFVPDEGASDAQSLCEVWRHMEPLNPFHYRELWCGVDGTAAASPMAPGAVWVRPEPPHDWNAFADGDCVTEGSGLKMGDTAVKKEAQDAAQPCSVTRVAGGVLTTRAAHNALQRALRAVGLPEELSCMVLLSARIPPGARLTRKQEKILRLRAQRRPAPPRPIRRGAKVFVPVATVVGGAAGGGMPGGSAGGGCGLLDVTALGPRVMRLASTGFADAAASTSSAGYAKAPSAAAVMGEFAFDDDDGDDKSTHSGGRGRRAGMKRRRHGAADDGLDDGDAPLIASGRWGLGASAGGNASGSVGAAAGAGTVTGAVTAQGDDIEEDNDEEDALSTGMVDDDDDENVGSEDDAQEDGESFGGGDDGDDSF
ncbi:hypothetical protein LSCM1_06602 [Leishmania martiniquensis]|uniref:Uncharacterized protein n=1 Tax=Leishmania martiniquensis TaxID=1580590 RepID=A0A836KT80_9TRYP|nr:hypothetical protein LSCM1_06602 [Leishmania martiniquensis]